ncbi:MAG TPA: sulfatase [Candidatus Binatia bacterium]|nr:sulfatase [Candidatus Binatia bacterium]
MPPPPIGRALLVIALALAAACSRREPALVPVVDLVAAFPATAAGSEQDRIDFGTAAGDAVLVDGWWSDRARRDDVVWATDRRSALRLFLGDPAERRLRIRCGGVARERRMASPRSTVYVRLNRRPIGTIRVGGEMETFELPLPKSAQQRGDNLLELEHPMIVRRGRAPSGARPRGAVAYDWLEIAAADGARPPRPQLAAVPDGGDAVVLPGGTRVDYFLRAPARGRLTLAVEGDGDSVPELQVGVVREGGRASTLLTLAPRAGVQRELGADLGAPAGQIVELSFAATAVGSDRGAVKIVHPLVLGAPPGRGVGRDSDGAGATAAAVAADPSSSADAVALPARHDASGRPPNVLLYVIDTLRADHLGCYGYPLATSPHIDALAREGVLFERTVAQASWTKPAVASLLTGLDPLAHGATSLRQAIRPGVATLAERLAAQGWETAAFVTNVNVSAPFGFARGFETFEYLPEDESRPSRHVLSDALGQEVARWLDRTHDRPFFLWVHSTDPHAPYTPPPELAERFRPGRGNGAPPGADPIALGRRARGEGTSLSPAEVPEIVALYDGEIAFNDASLGALLDELRRRGLYDSTLIVVTADHGEEFGDHGGFDHGHTLYEELIRVPLVVRLPAGRLAGARRAAMARQIDLVPTLLDQLGIAPDPDLPGRSLFARDGAEAGPVEAFSHTRLARRELAAITSESWKSVQHLAGARREDVEVFDLAGDPHEHESIARRRPVTVGYAAQSIRRAIAAGAAGASAGRGGHAPVVDRATEERLRALGYAE